MFIAKFQFQLAWKRWRTTMVMVMVMAMAMAISTSWQYPLRCEWVACSNGIIWRGAQVFCIYILIFHCTIVPSLDSLVLLFGFLCFDFIQTHQLSVGKKGGQAIRHILGICSPRHFWSLLNVAKVSVWTRSIINWWRPRANDAAVRMQCPGSDTVSDTLLLHYVDGIRLVSCCP